VVNQGALSPAEEAVLSVYKVRRIHPGYGLTATTFRKELMYMPLPGIAEAITSLLGKGYMSTHPIIKDFYMLTKKGYSRLEGGAGSSARP